MAATDSGSGGCYVCGEPAHVKVPYGRGYVLVFCALCVRGIEEYRKTFAPYA